MQTKFTLISNLVLQYILESFFIALSYVRAHITFVYIFSLSQYAKFKRLFMKYKYFNKLKEETSCDTNKASQTPKQIQIKQVYGKHMA